MLKFCYDIRLYRLSSFGKNITNQHLAMYQLADLYDIPDLRKEASWRLVNSLGPVSMRGQGLLISNRAIRSIRKVIGSDAHTFADNSIQQDVYNHVVEHIRLFYQNALFRSLLADGCMFSESFAHKFAEKVAEYFEIVPDPHPRIHRRISWSSARSRSPAVFDLFD